MVTESKGSLLLELQQRSIEFDSIIAKHQNIRSTLVERMPVLDEATFNGRRGGIGIGTIPSTSQGSVVNGVVKMAAAPLVDLLDLGDDPVANSSSTAGNFLHDLLDVGTNTIQPQKNGTDVLLDLLSIESPHQNGSSTHDNNILSINQDNNNNNNNKSSSTPIMDLLDGFGPTPTPPPPKDDTPTYPPLIAFESKSLRLMFNFNKQPGNPQTTEIEANFTNKSSDVYSDFVFQAAVPKFLQLHLEPASSNTLPGNGNGSITQKLRVTNSQHGKKSMIMRIRISYKLNNKEVLEEGQISNIPREI